MSSEPSLPRRLWKIAARAVITLSILAYIVYKLDWRSLGAQVVRADPGWLLAACLLFGVVFFLAALRWWLLLRVQDIVLPLSTITALTLIGQFFNTFMLGSVGGDVVKAVYVQSYVPNRRTHATLSVIMDRVLGLAILLFGSLIALPWQMRLMMTNENAHTAFIALLVMAAAMVAGGALMAVAPFHRASPGLRRLWQRVPHHHVIELVVSGFRQHGVALKWTLASVVIGIAVTLVLNLAGYCIAKGIGLDVTYARLLIITTVVVCVTSLPISIGGHGVREAIFVLMFAAFGVAAIDRSIGSGQELAILFSVLFFTVPLVWSIVGAIVYLTFRHEGRIGAPSSAQRSDTRPV